MANTLQSSNYTKTSEHSSDEPFGISASESSLKENVSEKRDKSKKILDRSKHTSSEDQRLQRKQLESSENLSGTEDLLKEALGKNLPVKSVSEKNKNRTGRSKSMEKNTSKTKSTKFRFPKSKSSKSGQYSHVKSRYLDVFKKIASAEETTAK